MCICWCSQVYIIPDISIGPKNQVLFCLRYKAAWTGNTQNSTRLNVQSYNPTKTCSQSHTVKTLWGELKLLGKVYEFKVMFCLTGNHSKSLKVSSQGQNMVVCSGAATQPCFLEKLQNKRANVTRANPNKRETRGSSCHLCARTLADTLHSDAFTNTATPENKSQHDARCITFKSLSSPCKWNITKSVGVGYFGGGGVWITWKFKQIMM